MGDVVMVHNSYDGDDFWISCLYETTFKRNIEKERFRKWNYMYQTELNSGTINYL